MGTPIQGTQAGNTLYGTAGNDSLLGHQGDDIFDLTNSIGRDTLNGQGGMDTAIFAGRFQDYVISFVDTGNLKTTVSGTVLDAELKNIETVRFDNATYDVATHTAQITTVSVSDAASATEGAANAQLNFTFTRTGDLSHGLDVTYALGGTAASGADYTAPAVHTVHFDAGSATAVLSLAVNDDAAFEGPETVGVQLVADSHYDFGAQTSATGTIVDNDTTLPALHISNASAVEGGNLVFHVSIDAPTDHDITFQAFTDTGTHPPQPNTAPINFGTATPGNLPGGDYDGFMPTDFTIHAGDTSVDISVHTRTDLVNEGDETMSLRLQNPNGATTQPGIGTGRGVGTIVDNPVTLPLLHVSNASAVEGGNMLFQVSIDAPTNHDITFQAFTDTGTHPGQPGGSDIFFGNATGGADYDGFPPTTYTIHAGDTSVDVSVHARTDFVNEGDETMSLRLQNPTGATIQPGLGTSRGVGTIVDDPVTKVSFYADPGNIAEGNDLTFHFHRDVTTNALDVKYWMGTFPANGATPGTDFTADNTTFTFVPADSNSTDFEAGQDHWTDPSMFVHFDAGQADAALVLHTILDGVAEGPGPQPFTVQFDFVANGSHVQFDGAASTAAYLAHGATDQTQVNIGHILDA